MISIDGIRATCERSKLTTHKNLWWKCEKYGAVVWWQQRRFLHNAIGLDITEVYSLNLRV